MSVVYDMSPTQRQRTRNMAVHACLGQRICCMTIVHGCMVTRVVFWYACRAQVKNFYSDQGGSDRKLRANLCLDSSEASAEQLNTFSGKVKRGEWDKAINEAPFLFNALEQLDALHVVFGASPYVSIAHVQFPCFADILFTRVT